MAAAVLFSLPPPPDGKPAGDSSVKVPTAPWMPSPLRLSADQLLDRSNTKPNNRRNNRRNNNNHHDSSLTAGVRGGRSRQAMLGIIRNIKKLRNVGAPEDENHEGSPLIDELRVPEVDDGENKRRNKAPWAAAAGKVVLRRERKERVVRAAEQILPVALLGRLRAQARGMRNWVKAKKVGITAEVVEEIHRGWVKDELVMVRVVEPLCRNMDRAREIVEVKMSRRLFITHYSVNSLARIGFENNSNIRLLGRSRV